jgi:hypothetical protein
VKRLFALIAVLFALALPISHASAASQTAYQDYVFQFDQYRQLFNNFRIAVGEYHQFNSLESQQIALDKAKLAIGQRNVVGRTYLLFLNEKVSENPGILTTELNLYRTLITNEIAFLDQQSTLANSVSSTDDAERISKEFAKHYPLMVGGMRQIIVGIQLGYLNYFAVQFENSAKAAQDMIAAVRPTVAPAKQAALDRWLLEISNKRNLYQQKSNAIRTASYKMAGDDIEQVRKFNQIQTDMQQARQYLIEGTSFLNELVNALKYQ